MRASCLPLSFHHKRGSTEKGWVQNRPFLFEWNALIWIGRHCTHHATKFDGISSFKSSQVFFENVYFTVLLAYLKCALKRGGRCHLFQRGNLDDDALGLAYLQLATEAAGCSNGPQPKSDRALFFELIEYDTMNW